MTKGFDVLKALPEDIDMVEQVEQCLKEVKKGNGIYKEPDGLRKVCAACGYLRTRIRNHDEKFFLAEGRLPSEGAERASTDKMQAQQRELKRHARTFAATRIQSLARGRRARRVVWGVAGKDRDTAPADMLAQIRNAMAEPQANEAMRFERQPSPDTLQALMERINAERKLAGREYPNYESNSEELHAEKALIKTVLKSHVNALTARLKHPPTAMDLETAKPVFVLYHILNSRIKQLDGIGADTESRRAKEESSKERLNDLRDEAKRLKVVLSKYEEAFVAEHGRKMKSQSEIEPIKKEYARFKAVKKELQALGSSTDRSIASSVATLQP